MIRFEHRICHAILIAGMALGTARASRADISPGFQEMYDLLQSHLKGVSAEELNRAAMDCLVAGLKPRAAIISGDEDDKSNNRPLISQAAVFDGNIAYLLFGEVHAGLAARISESLEELAATNKLAGLVLDLRFAQGDDYAAAAGAADLFLGKERALLDWGNGISKSKTKSEAIELPVAVLVNGETAGAAEALAAVLRDVGRAVIIGRTNSAGAAFLMGEYPLKDGRRLRIAVEPVKLGGGEVLTSDGVKPDIMVSVRAEDERSYLANPYREEQRLSSAQGSPSGNNAPGETNRVRRRLNEAELVRERREGANVTNAPTRDADAEKPVVRDPALARALDLLKGFALVRQWRSK